MKKSLLTVLLTLLTSAATATPADAGTYDVWSCAGPSGEPLPAKGWAPEARNGYAKSGCGQTGGALSGELRSDQIPVGSYARWIFDAPRDTIISGVTIQRAASSSGLYGYWGRSYFFYRDAPLIAEGYGLDVCAYLGGPCKHPGDYSARFGEASRYSSPPLAAGRLIASAQCDGSQPCPARDLNERGAFSIFRARIGLQDGDPPDFGSTPTGSLLDTAGPVSGERTVRFAGSDRGGGVRGADVLVDGQSVADTRVGTAAGCKEPFRDPVPCPLTASGTIVVDTNSLTNGEHRVQLALIDAANNRTLSQPVVIQVHNDKGPNGAGASRAARLSAKFSSSAARTRTARIVRFGKRAVVTGRLVDGHHDPIGGAVLQVRTRLDRLGAREKLAAEIRTRTDGRFRWRVPKGPSRHIRIGYRAYMSDPGEAASAEVRLGVRPRIAFTVRPSRVTSHGRIRFKGRLRGGPGKAGVQVTIEAVGRRVRERVPVTTLHTDRRGRFRFRYQFLRSFAPFTYRFRARLMRQAAYPYTGGASRIVTVRIVR